MLGLPDAIAKAKGFEDFGLRKVRELPEPVKEVHPLHFAVYCQCVLFVCVPVLNN